MQGEQRKGKDFLTYAMGYARKLGLRVFPLVPGKKEPLIPNWQNEATTDEAKIRKWWTRWPNANIGIVTGEYRDGYFYVLDFDPRNGGNWWAEVGEDVLPPTWVVHSARGGRHFYYRSPEPVQSAKLREGVDLKGKGGYVVAPPSDLYDENGNHVGEWGWQVGNMPKDLEMGEGAGWVLDELSGRRDGGAGKDGVGLSLWLMPPLIPKGSRHNYLVSLAGALLAAGLSEREIEAALWGAIELLETREDFDPVAEIKGILKGLQKWEGETYSIGSLLRRLPERTAAVVRRAIIGGTGETDSVAADTESKEPAAPHARAVGGSQGGEAVRANVQPEGGVTGDNKGRGAKLLAAEIVSKLEMRQKEGGAICFVYRAEDGTELEAPCTPKGVKQLLGDLGVKLSLKEVETLLGVARAEVDDESKGKKGRKSKSVDIEDIKTILWRYKWVRWQGELWLVAKTKLLRADLDEIHGLLKQNGLDVGKETLRSYYTNIITDIPKDLLEGIVVTPEPTYGKVGNLRGLWFSHRGDLHLVTPTEWRVFPRGQWPDGVYTLDMGMQAVLPDWDGRIDDLLIYWKGITRRFRGNPKVALAMFLPVLFGQGHIGIILRGPAKSGKSTLLKALAFLHLGRKPHTPSGSVNMRDIIAALHRRQIVFFDEVNTFSNELQETLKRMITHDGTLMRALYTNLETVEAELRGSAVFCTTNLEKLASDLRTRCFVWDLEPQGGGAQEQDFLNFCGLLWRRALAGAIKLYQQAAKHKSPPNTLLPEIRFRDWLSWAYRYAQVLGVENEFVAYVAKSKRAAHRGDKYEFLLDAISHPNFDPQKMYLITELFELAAPISDETKRLQHSLGREGVRADLVALALDAGYNLSIEKKCISGDKRARYRFIFTPIEASEDDFLASLLREAGFTLLPDDDDDTPPPPEPTPSTPAPTTPSNTTPSPDNPPLHTPSGNTMAGGSAGEAKDAV